MPIPALTTEHASSTQNGIHTAFTQDDLQRIEKFISSAPVPAHPLTTADALAALGLTLRKARDRGHSHASLVQICATQGLQVNERQVRRAIGAAIGRKPAKKKTLAIASSAV